MHSGTHQLLSHFRTIDPVQHIYIALEVIIVVGVLSLDLFLQLW